MMCKTMPVVAKVYAFGLLPLVLDAWVQAATDILGDPLLYQRLSRAAVTAVAPYSVANAALGMADAARQALAGGANPPPRSSFRRP